MNRTIYYDNSAPTVNGASCQYARLTSYNQGVMGTNPPIPAGTTVGVYKVLVTNPPTYDTLVKGGSCSGYANIITAYGANADNCSPKCETRNCCS